MISFSEENKNDRKGFRGSKFFLGFSRQYSLNNDINRIMEKKISEHAKNLIKKLNEIIKKEDNEYEKQKSNHNKNTNLPPVT